MRFLRLGLFRPSGGLVYHWLALRSGPRWRPLVTALQNLLSEWQGSGDQLLLIGPSGGYTLPSAWLRGFRQVHAFDVDPLAPWFFSLRHKGVQFHRQDMFWVDSKLSLVPLQNLLAAYPKATVLICNILGQLPLENEVTEPEFEAFLTGLRQALEGRRWASYHDTYTHEPDGITVIDHMTSGSWTSGLETRTLQWPLRKNHVHDLQLVTQ